MRWRPLHLALLSLALLSAVASADRPHRHRRHRVTHATLTVATPPQPAEHAGAKMPVAAPTPVSLDIPPSFFSGHAALVQHDLIFFREQEDPENTSLRGGPYSINPTPETGFVPPPRADDQLELARAHDRVLLLRQQGYALGSAGVGFAMFGAMTMTSAHAPKFLRFLFDGDVHLGPAMFEGGGMGAGIGGPLP